MNTGERNAEGRAIYVGPRGGAFVVKGKRKVYIDGWKSKSGQRDRVASAVVSNALSRHASLPGFAAAAVRAASSSRSPRSRRPGPRGMGGTSDLFVKNADGEYAIDPVTLERIPESRAVRVNARYFDSRTVRALVSRGAANPLTRKPFPANIRNKFGSLKISDATAVRRAAAAVVAAYRTRAISAFESFYGSLHALDIWPQIRAEYGVDVFLDESWDRRARAVVEIVSLEKGASVATISQVMKLASRDAEAGLVGVATVTADVAGTTSVETIEIRATS